VWESGSHSNPALQSKSSRQLAHSRCPLLFTQNGASPPHGEHIGPQKIAESHGAQSAASLQ
jgi:hypothetical protein